MKEVNGKTIFTEPDKVSFNGIVLQKAACK